MRLGDVEFAVSVSDADVREGAAIPVTRAPKQPSLTGMEHRGEAAQR